MTVPRRIQLRRTKGWRKPAGAVVVTRATKWGNPYRVGVHGDAETCVARYRALVASPIDNTKPPCPPVVEVMRAQDALRNDLAELRGRDLCCWCPPGEACHADVLIEVANREEN